MRDVTGADFARVDFLHILQLFQIIVTHVELQYGIIKWIKHSGIFVRLSRTHENITAYTIHIARLWHETEDDSEEEEDDDDILLLTPPNKGRGKDEIE